MSIAATKARIGFIKTYQRQINTSAPGSRVHVSFKAAEQFAILNGLIQMPASRNRNDAAPAAGIGQTGNKSNVLLLD